MIRLQILKNTKPHILRPLAKKNHLSLKKNIWSPNRIVFTRKINLMQTRCCSTIRLHYLIYRRHLRTNINIKSICAMFWILMIWFYIRANYFQIRQLWVGFCRNLICRYLTFWWTKPRIHPPPSGIFYVYWRAIFLPMATPVNRRGHCLLWGILNSLFMDSKAQIRALLHSVAIQYLNKSLKICARLPKSHWHRVFVPPPRY